MKKNNPKYLTQRGFMPILVLIVIVVLGFVGYLVYKNYLSNRNSQVLVVSSPSPSASPVQSDNKNNCDIVWIDPVLPKKGTIEPLFLREADSIKGAGYEGIVRRQVEDDDIVSVDLITNLLPDDNSPYYLWAVADDSKGVICSQTNLGPLEKIANTGSWGAGPFTLPVKNINDAQLFVITQKGFGSSDADKINNLSDPNIILEGAYEDNHK